MTILIFKFPSVGREKTCSRVHRANRRQAYSAAFTSPVCSASRQRALLGSPPTRWDPVHTPNAGSVENTETRSMWALFLILEGKQICVAEESRGSGSLPFLMTNSGAQLSRVRNAETWLPISFNLGSKKNENDQKRLRFSPRRSPHEKQDKLRSAAGHFPEWSPNEFEASGGLLCNSGSRLIVIIILLGFRLL